MRAVKIAVAVTIVILAAAAVCVVLTSGRSDGFTHVTGEKLPAPDIRVPCILSTSAKTVHTDTDCVYLESTKEENKLTVDMADISYYIDEGYKYCKRCSPEYINFVKYFSIMY